MVNADQLNALETLRDRLPDAAKDMRLNLQSVLKSEHLSAQQIWGTALTAACFLGHDELRQAITADARAAGIADAVFEDAHAAASIMAMNTVYYRFRHMVSQEEYAQRSARLRMSHMARPATSKADFELFALAVAALEGCEGCIRAHEKSVRTHDLGPDHVHDAVRIAAVIKGVATALTASTA